MNPTTYICSAMAVMACTSMAIAQTNAAGIFLEAAPPAGVVKGFMKAGGRYGALIAGGRTVYSNDTFAVTARGHKVTWQVLEVTDKGGRFAREQSAAEVPHSPPPGCVPNFGGLVMMLEDSAREYKAATTDALKDQVMAAARDNAKSWCASNRVMCVKGTLSNLTMADDNTALLRLTNVDCGLFKTIRHPNLYVHSPLEIKIHLTRDQAQGFKAGNTAILSGRPVFRPGTDILLIGDALTQKGALTCFRILTDTRMIGAIDLADPKYDIFDPKAETVQVK